MVISCHFRVMANNDKEADLEIEGKEENWVDDTEKKKLMNKNRETIIAQLADERKNAKAKLDHLTQQCADEKKQLNTTIDQLTLDCAAKDTKINDITTQLADLKTANQSAQNKVDSMATELLTAQNNLQLEKDITSKLMSKLDNADYNNADSKPSVLFLSEEDHIFKLLDDQKVSWSYKNLNDLASLESLLSDSEFVNECRKHDLILVMLGRCDILGDGDGVKMLFSANKIISMLAETKVPFRMIQILPVKGAKYITDFTLFNRRLMAKPEGNPINIMKVFENLSDSDIFVRAKITIKDFLLKRVANEIVNEVGVPDIIEAKPDDKPDSDDEELTEFLPIYRRHMGAIIGEDGETVQNLREITNAKISVIEYKHNESMRAAVLVTGDRSRRLKSKQEVAVIIKQKDSEFASGNQKPAQKPAQKPVPQKRNQNSGQSNNQWYNAKRKR